jgi:hypothetical protein
LRITGNRAIVARKGLRLSPTVLLASGLLLLGCGRSNIAVPDELAGLKLSELTKGEKAAELINALHRSAIVGEQNVVAHYQGRGEVTLYVSRMASKPEARSLFDSMSQRLAGNPSPFGHSRQVKRQGILMRSVTGLGQLHYTFAQGNSVYWLSADLTIADQAVNDLLSSLVQRQGT